MKIVVGRFVTAAILSDGQEAKPADSTLVVREIDLDAEIRRVVEAWWGERMKGTLIPGDKLFTPEAVLIGTAAPDGPR